MVGGVGKKRLRYDTDSEGSLRVKLRVNDHKSVISLN